MFLKLEGATTGLIEAILFYYDKLTNSDWNKNIFNNYNVNKNILLKNIISELRKKLDNDWDVELNTNEILTIINNTFNEVGSNNIIYLKDWDIIVMPKQVSDKTLNKQTV